MTRKMKTSFLFPLGIITLLFASPVWASVNIRITNPQDQSTVSPPVDISVVLESTFQRPFRVDAATTSAFGLRENPLDPGTTRYHWGIDVDVTDGTNNAPPIHATSNGFITLVSSNAGSGNFVLVYYPAFNITVGYAHITRDSFFNLLDRVEARDRTVVQGEVIATAGNTSIYIVPIHVHLSVRPGFAQTLTPNYIDPMPFYNGTFTNTAITSVDLKILSEQNDTVFFDLLATEVVLSSVSVSDKGVVLSTATFESQWLAEEDPEGPYVIQSIAAGTLPDIAKSTITVTLSRGPAETQGWNQFQHDSKHT
ncbi:M23 family metallopeptidase, partial [Elusimicrobiota bacterium]